MPCDVGVRARRQHNGKRITGVKDKQSIAVKI